MVANECAHWTQCTYCTTQFAVPLTHAVWVMYAQRNVPPCDGECILCWICFLLLLLLLGCRKYSVWNELCTMWMKYREMPLIKCTPWWKKYRERKEIERYRNEDEKKKPQPMYVHMLNESLYKHRNAAMALQNSLKINHFWDAQITFPFSWKCWLTRL